MGMFAGWEKGFHQNYLGQPYGHKLKSSAGASFSSVLAGDLF
jgi:hypothetical protein